MSTQTVKAIYNEKDTDKDSETFGDVVSATPASVEVEFGDDLTDATERFGEEVVFGIFRQAAVIKAQSALRAQVKAKKDAAGIDEFFTTWKPSVGPTRVPKDLKEEGLKAYEKMTAEEKAEYKEMLADLD